MFRTLKAYLDLYLAEKPENPTGASRRKDDQEIQLENREQLLTELVRERNLAADEFAQVRKNLLLWPAPQREAELRRREWRKTHTELLHYIIQQRLNSFKQDAGLSYALIESLDLRGLIGPGASRGDAEDLRIILREYVVHDQFTKAGVAYRASFARQTE